MFSQTSGCEHQGPHQTFPEIWKTLPPLGQPQVATEVDAETSAAQIIAVPLLLEKVEGYPCAEKNRVEKLVDTTALCCDSTSLSPHCRLALLHDHFPHHHPKMPEQAQAGDLWFVVWTDAQVQEDPESVCACIPFRPSTVLDPPCVTAILESSPAVGCLPSSWLPCVFRIYTNTQNTGLITL